MDKLEAALIEAMQTGDWVFYFYLKANQNG